MEVHCYGEWQEDSNAVVIYTDKYGECCEDMFVDGAPCWAEAVERVTKWAGRYGCQVDEMIAC